MSIIPIRDFSCPELDMFVGESEPGLLHLYEPDTGVFLAEGPRVAGRALDAGYEPVAMVMTCRDAEQSPEAGEIISRCPDVPVYVSDESSLKEKLGFPLSRGLLLAMRRRVLPSLEETCREARRIAVLEDVENPTNVGAVMRSAAALGVDALLLTRGCSDPLYRRAVRVSMGTVFRMPWTMIGAGGWHAYGGRRTDKTVRKEEQEWPEILHGFGFSLAAMALRDDSVPVDDRRLAGEKKLAIVLGNENNGLKRQTLDACDWIVRIPMQRGVDSLNVAAASAVAFWELARRKETGAAGEAR